MYQQTHIYQGFLKEFQKLPKNKSTPTYLEICKYPGSRFEEICSRFLAFYLDPNQDHGFHNLFLESLINLIDPQNSINYNPSQIQVIKEENAEGKRLDLLIKSPDLIIGIENKIYSNVYNPLDFYSLKLAQYAKKNLFKVILSARKIDNVVERNKIDHNGFIIIYYSQYLSQIKNNIGSYITYANPKYLTFLYDFIQTIENMTGETLDNNPLNNFFSSNLVQLDEMFEEYTRYKETTLKVQKGKIAQVKHSIMTRTKDTNWWAWENWDLGYDNFHGKTGKPRIGIESSFEQIGADPLAKFRIYITTWSLKDFGPYEDMLLEKYPGHFLDKTQGNRVYLHIAVIPGAEEEEIVDKLDDTYQILKTIVENTSVS